jgi:hypothetical protein
MKRKQPFDLEKVTINIRKGDFARLRELHPQLGSGPVIARLVIGYLAKVDAKLAEGGASEAEMLEAGQES